MSSTTIRLSDGQRHEVGLREQVARSVGRDWISAEAFWQIVQRVSGIPEGERHNVGAAVHWHGNAGAIEARITEDGNLEYRAVENPRPLDFKGHDLNRHANEMAALERQAHEAIAASGRYVNPQRAELVALIRATVLELLAELDGDDSDNNTTNEGRHHD